jgi:hypothetical protein
MSKQVITLDTPELNAVEESKALQIKNTFEPMSKMLAEFEGSFESVVLESKEEITKDVVKKAKRLRLDISKVRIETEKARKSQKEQYLLAGKAIDGVSNILKWAVSEKEEKLKEIENHFENLEKSRLAKLQVSRASDISEYLEDAEERDLSSMEQDVWEAYFESKRKAHFDRIEAEAKAEKDRIEKEEAEAKEREAIRKENERLKAEAEEREKAESERKQKELAEQQKREKAEAEEKAKHEAELKKQREEQEKARLAEQQKREKAEAELKSKEEAERKVKEEAYQKEQAELSKGDSDKVSDLVNDIESLKTKYTFKSSKNKAMYVSVVKLLEKVIVFISK